MYIKKIAPIRQLEFDLFIYVTLYAKHVPLLLFNLNFFLRLPIFGQLLSGYIPKPPIYPLINKNGSSDSTDTEMQSDLIDVIGLLPDRKRAIGFELGFLMRQIVIFDFNFCWGSRVINGALQTFCAPSGGRIRRSGARFDFYFAYSRALHKNLHLNTLLQVPGFLS